MILFCPKCQNPLESFSLVNSVCCFKCKTAYYIKIDFIEVGSINDKLGFHDIRQLESPRKDETSVGEEVESDNIDGPVRTR